MSSASKREPAPLSPYTYTARGIKRGEPLRFVWGHNGRINNKGYIVNEESGCWEWQGCERTKGTQYGVMRHEGRNRPVHAVFYERAKGRIPDGLQIDHLCRNRRCVNPDHLEAVTGEVNRRRAGIVKLTSEQVEEIRARWAALPKYPKSGRVPYGMRTKMAAEYGIGPRYLGQIIRGESWA